MPDCVSVPQPTSSVNVTVPALIVMPMLMVSYTLQGVEVDCSAISEFDMACDAICERAAAKSPAAPDGEGEGEGEGELVGQYMNLVAQFHTNLIAVDSESQLQVKESLDERAMKWSSQLVTRGNDAVIVALLK